MLKPRLLVATALVALAGYFAWRGTVWPRRPLTAAPMVVTRVFAETRDTLKRGETLSDLFARHGIASFQIPGPADLSAFDPRRLAAGLVFNFRRDLSDSIPAWIEVRTGPEQRLRFVRVARDWSMERAPIAWRSESVRMEGPITSSLYETFDGQVDESVLGQRERVRLAWDLADIYAWQVDFTRDIQPGDRFTVLVEREVSEEGEVRFGRVLAANLSVDGRSFTAYRYLDQNGRPAYYDADGLSLHRAFLRAPLQFRRISSGFRRSRFHPVLGIWRGHQGTDYAADAGTPVIAAGDGEVVRAEWTGGYGNLIEIRHANGITTRYGHLQGFARGIAPGARVGQGETIGYVGSTGLATGAHLHFEFRIKDIARNPGSIELGTGEPIPASEQSAFRVERDRLNAGLERRVSLAMVD